MRQISAIRVNNDACLDFYNYERPHQSLQCWTLASLYTAR